MNLKQNFIPLLLFVFTLMGRLDAQSPKPMVAYRVGIDWHFYNTKNELMFPVNKVIAPPMVTAYFHGWCKVGLPGVREGEIVIRNGVINEKGIEVPLDEMPDRYNIVGIDIEQGKKIISISNWTVMGVVNEAGQRVPSTPTYHWQRLGNGWGASYGNLPEDQEKQAEADFPMAGESEMEYEIWDIQNAKMVFKLKAEEIGAYGEGYLTAKKDGLWGVVKDGKWELKPNYKNIGAMSLYSFDDYDDYTPYARSFEKGAIPAQNEEGKWGLINTKGNWLLAAEYDNVFDAKEGNWYFLQGDIWVLSDANGKLWKNLEMERPQFIHEGLVFNFTEDQVWQLVNASGKVYSTLANEPVSLGKGYFYTLTKEEQVAVYGPNGKLLNTFEKGLSFGEVGSFLYDLAPVLVNTEKGEELAYLDKKGKFAIAPGKVPFKGGDLPEAMDGFIYIYKWADKKHLFYNLSGELIREDGTDGNWEMMMILQDGNAGFWAPY